MSDELKYKAIAYWQDRLAKFFPKSPGPTTCEIEMFEAGYKLLEAENTLLREALENILRNVSLDWYVQLEGNDRLRDALEILAAEKSGVKNEFE